METLFVSAHAVGDADAASASLIAQLRAGLGPQAPVLVTVFCSTEQPLERVAPALRAAFPTATLVGASTAGEFSSGHATAGGSSAAAIAGDFVVHAGLGRGVRADLEAAVEQAVASQPESIEGFSHRTGLLFVDGLSGLGEEATLTVALRLGAATPLAGGAAGDDMHFRATYVAYNETAATDALVVASIFSKKALGLGVKHGHVPLSKPLIVTRSEGNVVHTLDGRPAWDAWIEATRDSCEARKIDPASLSGPALINGFLGIYEAGLPTGAEFKVRLPMARLEGGAMAFSCGMPEGTAVCVMDTTPEQLRSSADTAVDAALAGLGGERAAGALVFDCRNRKDLLASGYPDAIGSAAKTLGAPLAGFQCYGEIAMNTGDFSGYHNTTAVVLAFPR